MIFSAQVPVHGSFPVSPSGNFLAEKEKQNWIFAKKVAIP